MTNKERYDKVFMAALSLEPEQLTEDLTYHSVETWDSVGHMSLMAALEAEFDIMLDTDDIIDFSSHSRGLQILEKYDLRF